MSIYLFAIETFILTSGINIAKSMDYFVVCIRYMQLCSAHKTEKQK